METRDRDTIEFFKITEMDSIELIRGYQVTSACSRHFHDSYVLGVIEEGMRRFARQGIEDWFAAGDIYVLNPGDVHECWNHETSYYALCLDEGFMEKVLRSSLNIEARAEFRKFLIRDPILHTSLFGLIESLEKADSTLEIESRCADMIGCLIRRHGDFRRFRDVCAREVPALCRIREYLEDRYAESISIDELVALSGISAYHLIRSFTREYGLPPHAYQMQVRVREARKMLWNGMSLCDISLQTGFSDQAHFTRFFKKATGLPPGRFARNLNMLNTI